MKVHFKNSKTKTNRVKPLVLCFAIAGIVVGNYQPIFAEEIPIATSINQERKVTGKIIDESGEPIIGANVIVKGSTTGTTTDINGEFSIQIPSDKIILDISYIGYKSQEIFVDKQKTLEIRLISRDFCGQTKIS